MRDALEGKDYVEQYVQALTHEIKSPLSAIQGAAELLDEDMSAERRRQFVDNVRSESHRIHGIVERMLRLTAVEKRKELKDVEEIPLNSLVDDIVSGMASVLEKKGVQVSREVAEGVLTRGERFLIRQAIANLLQNACDFSPEGTTVTVRAERADGSVSIVVEDSGPGVPDYALKRVFERFYSLARPDTGRKSTGLGLSFVRQVAELHGGSVELTNLPEGGARATLTLPSAGPSG
jgi:two-component system sensor histidine kinase CreC